MRYRTDRKKEKRQQAAGVSLMLGILMAVSPVPAQPAAAYVTAPQSPEDRGKSVAELNGYSEEAWAGLMDNTLTYEEIPDLVRNFNPAIASAWNSYDDSIRYMETSIEELHARQRDMGQMKDISKSSGAIADYGNYTMQEMILSGSTKNLRSSVDRMKRPATAQNRPLSAAERQVTAGVQQLMIACASLASQRAIVAESAGMYEKLLSDANARYSVGMATAADVQSAQTAYLQARSQLSSIDASAYLLKKNLILLCGWSENADPEIAPLPAPDPARIDAMDPDADLTKAIAHSQDIINFRNEQHSLSTYSKNMRHESEETMNQNLLVNLRDQYRTVLSARESWEAAKSGLQAAEMTKNAADMQYQLGMLSTAQYLGALTQYQSARTTMLTAESTFFQAMETYDWMLNGVSSVE